MIDDREPYNSTGTWQEPDDAGTWQKPGSAASKWKESKLLQLFLDRAAETATALPIHLWPGWVIYFLEALERESRAILPDSDLEALECESRAIFPDFDFEFVLTKVLHTLQQRLKNGTW